MTTIRILSDLYGTFYWPAGETWIKPVDARFTVTDEPIHGIYEISSLREAIDRITADPDSLAAPLLSPDGVVEVSRKSKGGKRVVTKRFALGAFPSIADLVADDPLGGSFRLDDFYDPFDETEDLVEVAGIASRVEDALADADPLLLAADRLATRRAIAGRIFAELRSEEAEA